MHLSILCPYQYYNYQYFAQPPPPGRCRGRDGDLLFLNSNSLFIGHASQSNSSHLRDGDLRGNLLMLTILYMHILSCQIPHVYV